MPNTDTINVNKTAFDSLVAKSRELDAINSAGIRGTTSHHKITIDRSTFNTLVRNTNELHTLYNAGLMDTDLFDSIDWDAA